MRKEYDLCEHDINIKINKTLSFCQNCARITLIQKVKTHNNKIFCQIKIRFFSLYKFKI